MTPDIDQLHQAAITAAQQKDYHEAAKQLKRALQLQPKNIKLLNSYGLVLKHQSHFRAAETTFQQLLKLEPNYVPAYNNLAGLYLTQGDTKKAQESYQSALKIKPDYADALFNLATLEAQAKHYLKAKKLLIKLTESHPKFAPAYGQLAQLAIQAENTKEAISHFKKRLELDPAHGKSHHDLGLLYAKESQLEAATIHLEEALELNYRDDEASFHLASVYHIRQKLDDAVKHYLQQLQQGAHEPSYYNIAVIYMDKGRNKDALEYFKQALSLKPNNLDNYLNIAGLYLKSDKHEDAVHWYQQALTLAPDNTEIKHILSGLTQSDTPSSSPQEYVEHLFDSYANNYDQHLRRMLEYRAPEALLKAVTHHLDPAPNSLTILDLGCGTGLAGEAFKPFSRKLIGIDLSENMLALAKQKNIYNELTKADALNSLKEERHIDLILAADVFTYIGDLTPILSAAKQSLSPAGCIAFTVEKALGDKFTLQETLRYAHSKAYLDAALKDFTMITFDNVILRKQQGKEVEGYLVIATQ